MSVNQDAGQMESMKTRLSSLWIFLMLNWLYCDVMFLMDPVLRSGSQAMAITPGFLLGASILMEIPMIMILISKFSGYKVNRTSNIIAAILMTLVQVMSLFVGTPSIYYIFFSVIEICGTVYIAWAAIKWQAVI